MTASLLAALLFVSAGSPLVRDQPGTVVKAPSAGARNLIPDDSGTLVHLRWNGIQMVDALANGWTMTGTVPQNARSAPTPASAGVFSDANYYSLGTGADLLDIGTLSVCVVFTLTGLPGTSSTLIISDGVFNTDGWYIYAGDTGLGDKAIFTAGSAGAGIDGRANTTNSVLVGLNVVCGGFDGGSKTSIVKLNLGTVATKAKAAAMTLPTTRTLYLGRHQSAGPALGAGKIHEVWASSTAPSDALFTAIQSAVKAKIPTVAW